MKFTLYKPNAKNTGSAFTFDATKDNSGKPVLFVSMIQQYSWDDQKKTGSFKQNAKNPDKSTTIKLTEVEAGEFISSFKTRIPFIGFHKTQEKTTVIKLTPWDKNRTIKNKNVQGEWTEQNYKTPAWGFTITKDSSQYFKLPMEAGEAEALSILLEHYIKESFTAQAAAYKKTSNNSYQKPAPKPSLVEEEDDDVPF
ncbi:hypothetical protein OAG04_00260 [bacterium]|nr:hypothetical protein [bacterium]